GGAGQAGEGGKAARRGEARGRGPQDGAQGVRGGRAWHEAYAGRKSARQAAVSAAPALRGAPAPAHLLLGAVPGKAPRVIAGTRYAHEKLGADLVLFPELTLCGYPPEDLLFHRGFRRQIEEGLTRVRREATDAAVLVGFPEYTGAGIYNSAALLARGE